MSIFTSCLELILLWSLVFIYRCSLAMSVDGGHWYIKCFVYRKELSTSLITDNESWSIADKLRHMKLLSPMNLSVEVYALILEYSNCSIPTKNCIKFSCLLYMIRSKNAGNEVVRGFLHSIFWTCCCLCRFTCLFCVEKVWMRCMRIPGNNLKMKRNCGR